MVWRGIVLAALGVGFGIAAGLCIGAEARLYAALIAGGAGPTAARSASAAQFAILFRFASPLVAGCLLCIVALLVVLAWRWQAPGRGPQD